MDTIGTASAIGTNCSAITTDSVGTALRNPSVGTSRPSVIITTPRAASAIGITGAITVTTGIARTATVVFECARRADQNSA